MYWTAQVIRLREEHFEDFVEVWQSFDPEGKGKLPASSEDWEPLAKLIDMLPAPLGLEVLSPSRTTSVILCIAHLQLRDGFQLRHLTSVQMSTG